MRRQDTFRRVIRREVRVPHRRRDIPMSQQFLNGPQIDSSHDPLTRPEMAEIVKADPFQTDRVASCVERSPRIAPAVLRQRVCKDILATDHARQRSEQFDCVIGQRDVPRLVILRGLNGQLPFFS
jgi:hypothetical protein